MDVNALLKHLYSDKNNPAAFSGVDNLYKEAKRQRPDVTKKQVKDFLETQTVYTLHKQRRLRFPRERTIPAGFMTGLLTTKLNFSYFI